MASQEDIQTFSDYPALDGLPEYRSGYLSFPEKRLAFAPGTFLFQIGDKPTYIVKLASHAQAETCRFIRKLRK